MGRPIQMLVIAIASMLAAACAGPGSGPSGSGSAAEPLIVFAASDLQFALADLAAAFAAEGNVKPTIILGSTGTFSQQIENGAPADVFFAADESYLARLDAQGLILGGTRQPYAIGRLVLIERAGLPSLTALSDVARSDVRRFAIANPGHAPYGRAAREALMSAGLWESLSPKLVMGENISQAFQFVQTGNADAGIVALSLALGVPGTRYTLIDISLHQPLVQAAAVIAGTTQPAAARKFLAFVNGVTGRSILKNYGFALPGER